MNKQRKIVFFASFIGVAFFLLWLILATIKLNFDQSYWQRTNDFYMVFDMTAYFDESERLSWFEMTTISFRRKKMAESLINNKQLAGKTERDVVEMLGKGSQIKNAISYALVAEARPFQFYGESGFIYDRLIVSFDNKGQVVSAHIASSDSCNWN